VERERWVESVVLAPAERWIVDARFDVAGKTTLVNRVRAIDHFAGQFFSEVDTLGVITVEPERAAPDVGAEFATLRTNPAFTAELARLRAAIARPPDKTLQLTLDPGKQLPFGLIQALRLDTGYVNPVEWSGTMPMMDWLPVARDVRWVLRDVATGRENMDIGWTFGKGDLVRIRLVNDRHTLHPMSHPLHIHGQRFLVLAVNGEPMTDRVWKDTVLLPTGSTIDLLVEMSNPGRWMMHCHIAEHLESGMHAVFEVK
jgi:FtsP/CotA-like multicopper oxidase with cupredoxin domain